LRPGPCWIAAGAHWPTRLAAMATGHPVHRATVRCIRATCHGCGHMPHPHAAHCHGWHAAAELYARHGWHAEHHRRLLWCPACRPTRPTGPPPLAPMDADQLAITDYTAPVR